MVFGTVISGNDVYLGEEVGLSGKKQW